MKISNSKSAIKYMVLFGLLFIANGAWAKDLFVAPNGSDSVSYASNSITSPWASPKQAWANAQAGDTVYFRAGTYNITSSVSAANAGTANGPITYKNYNNEVVTFTSTLYTVFWIDRSYIYVEGIICDGLGTGGATWWAIGYNTTATNFKATKLTAKNIGKATDNAGFIYLAPGQRSNNAIIEYCKIVGPGSSDTNHAGIIAFRSRGIKIRNNEISNYPKGIYYKHSNDLSDTGIEIYNNYIHNCGQSAIHSVSNYGNYHDNLLVGCGMSFGENAGIGDGGVGGNYNTIQHNTLYNATLSYWGNQGGGATYNIVKNNIFMTECKWKEYAPFEAHYTTSDYNLFPSGNIVKEAGIDYTITSWRAHAGTDAHSLSGSPTFAKTTPVSILDYALATVSLGKSAANDGKDVGANVSLVGANTSGSISTQTLSQIAPANPSGLTVQ